MLNYWWVTRPKRKLNHVPEILTLFSDTALNQQWSGNRTSHLGVEASLESQGLKRQGDRRDGTGGGGRTYLAWLKSLGLLFSQSDTRLLRLTLAGEAIIAGASPVAVLKNQVFKYQFPSCFSLGRNVNVAPRFKIRPFRFLIKLLLDSRLGYYFTEPELAKIVVTEAENESDKCYEYIISRILQYREVGDRCLPSDFAVRYQPSKGGPKFDAPFSHLLDIANTMVNWLEYTQLVCRVDGKVMLLSEKVDEAVSLLSYEPPFIDRPHDEEFFQRKFGVDPWHRKDSRNLKETANVTSLMLDTRRIQNAYIVESLKEPITGISSELIDKVAVSTGLGTSLVQDVLFRLYPHGSLSGFLSNYYSMAFKGTAEATDFEKATVKLFENVFGFTAEHVGPIGLTPDVLLLSDAEGYQAIIDNKAYSKYSISNDHHNRMVHNYIGGLSNYSAYDKPLAFYSYIAGGFGNQIGNQLLKIKAETGVDGSAVPVSSMIKLAENFSTLHLGHSGIRKLFSVNRKVELNDFM